jgi:ribonucleotide reductase beta subunit family protein with ferritin-like domain
MNRDAFLEENDNRFALFPIKHNDIWDMYKKHEVCFWAVEELNLGQDADDWNGLTPNEQHYLKMVLVFFSCSNGTVLEDIVSKFRDEVPVPEVRCFYGVQITMENVHAETYIILVDTYIKNQIEKRKLFKALVNFDCVRQKVDWTRSWTRREDRTIAERLIAFAAVEGIFFAGSVCAISWFKKRGLMKGLTFSNELISRDKRLHCDFACLLLSKLSNTPSPEVVKKIIKTAVTIEKNFICSAVSVELIGMNRELVSNYIEFVADHLLTTLGFPKIWNTNNPFKWMDTIPMQGKNPFFERDVVGFCMDLDF